MNAADKAAGLMKNFGICVFDLVSREQIYKACELENIDVLSEGDRMGGGIPHEAATLRAENNRRYVITALVKAGYIRKSVRSDARMYRVLHLPPSNAKITGG